MQDSQNTPILIGNLIAFTAFRLSSVFVGEVTRLSSGRVYFTYRGSEYYREANNVVVIR